MEFRELGPECRLICCVMGVPATAGSRGRTAAQTVMRRPQKEPSPAAQSGRGEQSGGTGCGTVCGTGCGTFTARQAMSVCYRKGQLHTG